MLMAHDLKSRFPNVFDLPEEERAELAGLLLDSLETAPDPDTDAAWAEEVKRRLADYHAGKVKTVPWSELRARLHRSDR